MIQPISGTWFEFRHHSEAEGKCWNATCPAFTCEQWRTKIREMAEIGMKYLALMAIAIDDKTFYPSWLQPQHSMGCADPLEAVLDEADKCGMKFFVGNDFFGDWTKPDDVMSAPLWQKMRLDSMAELAERYGRHESFHGWYYPHEAFIDRYFTDQYVAYVNECSREAHRLTPKAVTMIAPYGTRVAAADDKYVRQLEGLDVDIIAYQDEIGVRKTRIEESAGFFERLRKAHDRAGRSRIWADVEIFEFEGAVYKSALLPARFERVEKQLAAVSPFVETIMVYQYLGLMNKPGTSAFAGHATSTKLYEDYVRWLASRK